jgi:bifunctional DNase/RNase
MRPFHVRIVGCQRRLGDIFASHAPEAARHDELAEVDARPSDALVLAVKAKRPVFLSRQVLDACEDMTETLARLRKQA